MRRLPALLLAATFAVALAGCVGSSGTVSMSPVDDEALAERASVQPSALDDGTNVPFDALVANASGSPPADPDLNETSALLRYEERYYRLTTPEQDATASTNVATIYVDYEPSDGPYADEFSARVPFSSLPAADRTRLALLFERVDSPNRTEESERHTFRYGHGAFAASNLTDDRAFVITRDDRAVGVVVEHRASDVFRPEERYDATLIAGSDGAFADYVRRHYVVDLEDVSPEVGALLREARNGTAEETSTAINDLHARLPEHRAIEQLDRGYGGGHYLVRYDGDVYWLEFRCCAGGL